VQLHARAGVDDLGKYLSSTDQDKVDRAIARLSRAVERVAVDYSMENALSDLTSELVPERDNRSVTTPEWVETGIATYGCPVHPTTNGRGTEFTVSGYGPCSCRRPRSVRQTSNGQRRNSGGTSPAVRKSGKSGTGRSSGNNSRGNKEVQGVIGSGVRVIRPLPDDAGEHDRGTPSPALLVRGASKGQDGLRSFSSESYKAAIRSVYRTAGCKDRGHIPYTVDEIVAEVVLASSYAGAPLFSTNRDVLAEGTRLARRIIAGLRGFDPYVFGRRVQHGHAGPKTRLVWMAPLPTTIVGSRFSKRVMENLSRTRPFVWGTHGVERGAILSEIESKFRYVYSLDFSKFDSTVPARMIDDAFRVARTHLDLTEQDQDVWTRYVNDFIHSRIIAPDGHVYQVHKGIPSGSAFTSIIGSIVNLILVSYMWHSITGHELPHDRVLVMGDDVIIGSNTYVTKSQLASAATDLGFAVSVEKTDIVDTSKTTNDWRSHTHFVGYHWLHGQPHREEREIVKSAVYPERHRRREKHEWIVRLLGYAMTSREGLLLLTRVFPAQNTLQCYFNAADRASELGWDENSDDSDVDLPGQLRYRRRVEGESIELTPTKVTGGIFGRWR